MPGERGGNTGRALPSREGCGVACDGCARLADVIATGTGSTRQAHRRQRRRRRSPPAASAGHRSQNGERCLESYYLTSWNEDFLNATDCELAVGGEALRAHTAVLAARAPAFSPLLSIDGPRTLRDPFGITSLQHMLLLLRLCYRPEDADGLESAGMLDLLPGEAQGSHD